MLSVNVGCGQSDQTSKPCYCISLNRGSSCCVHIHHEDGLGLSFGGPLVQLGHVVVLDALSER